MNLRTEISRVIAIREGYLLFRNEKITELTFLRGLKWSLIEFTES